VCLQKLSADQRDLVEGYYFRQLTVESLGQRTQKSVDAVYKALQRIRQQLGDCILRTISEGRAQ
jgi:DNA-directed RNA polymerase specialized sigma24 family protein